MSYFRTRQGTLNPHAFDIGFCEEIGLWITIKIVLGVYKIERRPQHFNGWDVKHASTLNLARRIAKRMDR